MKLKLKTAAVFSIPIVILGVDDGLINLSSHSNKKIRTDFQVLWPHRQW
jgi:hypothetical protein